MLPIRATKTRDMEGTGQWLRASVIDRIWLYVSSAAVRALCFREFFRFRRSLLEPRYPRPSAMLI
jgi:hypothetical protein